MPILFPLCRYCGGGLFAAAAQPAQEQQLQSELLQRGLLHSENEALVWNRWRQLWLVCAEGHQPPPHAAGNAEQSCWSVALKYLKNWTSGTTGCCFALILHDVLFPVGASHGVSSELSWSYIQLPEVHVPVRSAAAAVHHPHGHRCACWYPHWGNDRK